MKIGYKATDKDMMCKSQQYKVGNTYFIENSEVKSLEGNITLIPETKENRNLRECSKNVLHYCQELTDCFKWYSEESSRYFKVEILGYYKDMDDKSCTTALKFIEELTEEDIKQAKRQKEIEQEEERLRLKELRLLQSTFPHIIIGGSLGLYLQGAKLERLEGGVGDFDLIHPFWVDLTEIGGVNHIDSKNSGNTFDETFNFNGVKLDLAIDPQCRYKVVEHNGHKYKVNTIENTLMYKAQYAAQKNGEKHRKDIYELLGIKN